MKTLPKAPTEVVVSEAHADKRMMVRSRYVKTDSSESRSEQVGWQLVAVLGATSLLLAIVAQGYLGFFMRYVADDYCFAETVLSEGLINAQRVWYVQWRGVFSHTFLISLASLVGVRAVPYLPSLALACWLAALTFALFQLAAHAGLRHAAVAVLPLAAIVLVGTLDGSPNIVQSFYWQSGMLSYTAPLVLLTVLIGLFAYSGRARIPRLLLLALSGGLSFIAGGFSETATAVELTAVFLALVVAMLALSAAPKRRVLPVMIAAMAGSLLATVIVVMAPGNAVRQGFFPQPPSLLSVAVLSPYYALRFMARSVLTSPWAALLSVAGPALLAFKLHPRDTDFGTPGTRLGTSLRGLVGLGAISAVLGFLVITSSFAPSAYALSDRPPLRAQIVPQFVLALMMVCWGYLGGVVLKGRYLPSRSAGLTIRVLVGSLILLLLVGGPIAFAYRTLSVVPELRLHASDWVRRDRQIRDAVRRGESDVVVPALGYTGGARDLDPSPNPEVNGCITRYYGLKSLRAGEVSTRDFPGWMKDGLP